MNLEALRRSYKPGRVRLLFIGESPPASGRFFYAGDSGLYRAMLEVFQGADPTIDGASFLEVFRASGCYLVDLCSEPVDRMPAALRRAAREAGEESLARAITALRPEVIATLLRSIEGNVARAIARANWTGPTIDLPYPGRWATLRAEFVGRLTPVIAGLVRAEGPR